MLAADALFVYAAVYQPPAALITRAHVRAPPPCHPWTHRHLARRPGPPFAHRASMLSMLSMLSMPASDEAISQRYAKKGHSHCSRTARARLRTQRRRYTSPHYDCCTEHSPASIDCVCVCARFGPRHANASGASARGSPFQSSCIDACIDDRPVVPSCPVELVATPACRMRRRLYGAASNTSILGRSSPRFPSRSAMVMRCKLHGTARPLTPPFCEAARYPPLGIVQHRSVYCVLCTAYCTLIRACLAEPAPDGPSLLVRYLASTCPVVSLAHNKQMHTQTSTPTAPHAADLVYHPPHVNRIRTIALEFLPSPAKRIVPCLVPSQREGVPGTCRASRAAPRLNQVH